jgi:hypothetical protein
MSIKTKQPVLTTSIAAAANLTETKKFIGVDGNYADAGAFALGVLDAATDAGKQAPVITYGIAIVLSGGAITAGAGVESNAAGKAISHNTGVLLGYALDAATGADQEIRIKLL